MTTVRLPLAGSQINTRNGSLAYDALLQNCIVEKAGEDLAVMKRDCFTPTYTPTGASGGPIRGMWEFSGLTYWVETYIVTGTPYVRLLKNPASPTQLWQDGTLSFGENGYPLWASQDPTNGKISLHSTTKLFSEASNAAVTKPTVSNLAAGSAWLDGYFFIYSVDGNIYNSSLNNPTTWNALGSIKPNIDVGYPTRLVRYINYIVAFGDIGYTAFYDAANAAPASPLSPVPNLNGKIGCYAANSVATVQDSLFWLGRDQSGAVAVYMLSGHQVKKVSTPAVDRYIKSKLSSFSTLSGFIGSQLVLSGHHGYYLGSLGLFYDTDTGSWSFLRDSVNNVHPTDFAWGVSWTAGNYVAYAGIGASPGFYENSIGTLSNTVYQEYSANVQVKIVTNEFERANNWKFVNDIDFISDKNIGTPLLRWTDDDFSSWSSYYSFNTANNKSNIYRLGRTRRRAFELTHTDNTPFRAYYLEIDYDFGER